MWGGYPAACKFRYEGDDKNPVRAHKQHEAATGAHKAATRAPALLEGGDAYVRGSGCNRDVRAMYAAI